MFAYRVLDFAEVFTKKVLMNSNMSISEMKNAIHEYSEVILRLKYWDIIFLNVVALDVRCGYEKSARRRRWV